MFSNSAFNDQYSTQELTAFGEYIPKNQSQEEYEADYWTQQLLLIEKEHTAAFYFALILHRLLSSDVTLVAAPSHLVDQNPLEKVVTKFNT